MIQEQYRRAAGNCTAMEGEKGWYASYYNYCLCEIDFHEKKARILKYLGVDTKNGCPLYSGVVKCGDLLYLSPFMANDIAVYDIKSDRLRYISLRLDLPVHKEIQKRTQKFQQTVYFEDKIFFLGYAYPAIVVLDIQTEKITYITDWIPKVTMDEKDNYWLGYFWLGYVQENRNLYLPLGCMNALLKLNQDTFQTELILASTIAEGFGGITKVDDKLYLLVGRGQNSGRVIWWNTQESRVEDEIVLEDIKTQTIDAIYPAVICSDKAYLLPLSYWGKRNAYQVGIYSKQVQSLPVLDMEEFQLDVDKTLEVFPTVSIMNVGKSGIRFATGEDLIWHEYNVETGICKDYKIYYENSDDELEQIYGNYIEQMKTGGQLVREIRCPVDALIGYCKDKV